MGHRLQIQGSTVVKRRVEQCVAWEAVCLQGAQYDGLKAKSYAGYAVERAFEPHWDN